MRIRRKIACGANPEALPATKSALKRLVAFGLVDPFEHDGLWLDRLVMPNGAELLLGFPVRSQGGKFTIDTTSGQWIFG
jgi:hypothetical protein